MPVVSILTQIPYNDTLQLPVAGGYVLYVLTGYYMRHTVFSKKIRYFLYAGGIIGAASMWLLTHWYTVRGGFASELFLDYKYCFSFAMAVGLFELCKNIPWEKFCHESGQKALSIIAQSSFGVYLIHIYFVEKYFEYTQGSHPILNMELGTILILCADCNDSEKNTRWEDFVPIRRSTKEKKHAGNYFSSRNGKKIKGVNK